MLLTIVLLAAISAPLPDFELPAATGPAVRLSAAANGRPVVVVFLGVDCPLANLYAPRLKELSRAACVVAIDSNGHDDLAAMATFSREHALPFPFLKDADARVAGRFGATRTPQAFVLDADRRVAYRGRIDDQYEPGGRNRPTPTRHDLAEAVRQVAAGERVAVPVTTPAGCVINRPRKPAPPARVTYARDIAPVVERNCRVCHRPGDVGPFPLETFAQVRDRAATIADVVGSRVMPPWHAAPEHGRFRNERKLTDRERTLVADWVALGCPEGEPVPPPPAPPATGWAIGTPDAVYAIPAPFRVPAEGVVEYQHFFVDLGFDTDKWVSAAELRPGNRRVVHHCSVFLQPPTATGGDEFFATDALGSCVLVPYTPGTGPLRLPDGMAKRIPAGWRLHFIVHYTPVGTPQDDRTELGLTFADPARVRKEVATVLLTDEDLVIPPGAAGHRVERTWTADRDCLLLSMFPHMHLRGKAFRYTAEYPGGATEVLLDVPAYDFAWQHRYELAEPKRLPAGTVLRCSAVFDNSTGNPANPDPAATVRAGLQSWDEMFNGYFEIALADQDLPAERAAIDRQKWSLRALTGAAALALLWGLRLARKRA